MAFEWWMVAAGANVFMVAIYAGIATIMIRGIHDGHQWRSNPIAVATAAVFVSCTVGHGLHLAHVLPPLSVIEPAEAAAARAMFADWRLIAWDAITAGTAIGYWFLRGRLVAVYGGASLSEDLQERHRQAALIHERVVAGLDQAQAELDAGQREKGLATLAKTLDEGKEVITTLLGKPGVRPPVRPGDLRREAASR